MECYSKKLEDLRSTPSNILFKITPTILNVYDKRSVFFTKPYLLAIYERNYRKISLANKIRYLKIPEMTQYPLDLNGGYETFCPRQSDVFSDNLDITLKYIMSSAAKGGGSNDNVDSVERTTIYTRRGTIGSIMKSNFVKKYNNWTVRVIRYNGNIYMVQKNDEVFQSRNEIKKNETHHARLDKLLFAECPNGSPKINEPCDENVTLNCVHRSSFGKFDIVYSGEVQGIIAEEQIMDFNDLEALNKCRFVLSKQIWDTLKYVDERFLNYWLNAYLANVNDLYVAYKNSEGIVEEPIEHKIVSDLPKKRFWKPNICTAFLNDFLEHVDKLMSNVNCLNTAYDFHFNANTKIISYDIYKGKLEGSVLTKEYMDFCNEKIN